MTRHDRMLWRQVSRSTLVIAIAAAVTTLSFSPPINSLSWHLAIAFIALVAVGVNWFIFALRAKNPFFHAAGAYTLLVAMGVVVKEGSDDPPTIALVLLTTGTVIAAVAGGVIMMRQISQLKEVEQLIFSRATSFAFGVTMLAVVTTALVVNWFDLGAPDPWLFFGAGLVAWFGALLYQGNKYG
jgi:hypothetical protein